MKRFQRSHLSKRMSRWPDIGLRLFAIGFLIALPLIWLVFGLKAVSRELYGLSKEVLVASSEAAALAFLPAG